MRLITQEQKSTACTKYISFCIILLLVLISARNIYDTAITREEAYYLSVGLEWKKDLCERYSTPHKSNTIVPITFITSPLFGAAISTLIYPSPLHAESYNNAQQSTKKILKNLKMPLPDKQYLYQHEYLRTQHITRGAQIMQEHLLKIRFFSIFIFLIGILSANRLFHAVFQQYHNASTHAASLSTMIYTGSILTISGASTASSIIFLSSFIVLEIYMLHQMIIKHKLFIPAGILMGALYFAGGTIAMAVSAIPIIAIVIYRDLCIKPEFIPYFASHSQYELTDNIMQKHKIKTSDMTLFFASMLLVLFLGFGANLSLITSLLNRIHINLINTAAHEIFYFNNHFFTLSNTLHDICIKAIYLSCNFAIPLICIPIYKMQQSLSQYGTRATCNTAASQYKWPLIITFCILMSLMLTIFYGYENPHELALSESAILASMIVLASLFAGMLFTRNQQHIIMITLFLSILTICIMEFSNPVQNNIFGKGFNLTRISNGLQYVEHQNNTQQNNKHSTSPYAFLCYDQCPVIQRRYQNVIDLAMHNSYLFDKIALDAEYALIDKIDFYKNVPKASYLHQAYKTSVLKNFYLITLSSAKKQSSTQDCSK